MDKKTVYYLLQTFVVVIVVICLMYNTGIIKYNVSAKTIVRGIPTSDNSINKSNEKYEKSKNDSIKKLPDDTQNEDTDENNIANDDINNIDENDNNENVSENSDKDTQKLDINNISKNTTKSENNNFDSFTKSLENEFSDYNGTWSIYLKDLNTKKEFSYNNEKLASASLIKLFIMAKVYQDIEDSKIDKSTVENLLEKMITVSDNESSNELVKIIGNDDFNYGMELLNEFIKSKGFYDTEQQRDLKDFRAVPVKGQNYTSVIDCGKLLNKIYNHNFISDNADKEMLDLLLRQTRKLKIPAGIPKNIKVANKTGENSDVENDVAIVFGENTEYILCIMSNNISDTADAQNKIAKLSKKIYNHFCDNNTN